MDWFPTTELRQKAHEVTQRLLDAYHQVGPERGGVHQLPAVDELVLTMLSQSTTDVNSWRGYRALIERFPNWDAVADAPVEAIEETIRQSGLARQKAPRIKHFLEQVRHDRGCITLDFLKELPPDEALAYLMAFTGVGRKTASCVLLFSLDMPAMPVDTHVLRVARRLTLIPEHTSADDAHDMLECLLPEECYMAFHVNVIAHGRQTCTARTPACERCPVLAFCPDGRQRLGKETTPPDGE
ncbi:MAG TPA: endonuclease III [Armatimonadota bacterium]|nr:endonuclease III [Armatimonadota bacterium]